MEGTARYSFPRDSALHRRGRPIIARHCGPGGWARAARRPGEAAQCRAAPASGPEASSDAVGEDGSGTVEIIAGEGVDGGGLGAVSGSGVALWLVPKTAQTNRWKADRAVEYAAVDPLQALTLSA